MDKYIVSESEHKLRLDKFLLLKVTDKSRSYLQKAIEEGKVLVNGKSQKSSYKVETNDEISFEEIEVHIPSIEKESIPLDIIYEDEDLVVINKPRGMVVHPANGHHEGTLVNALLYHFENLSSLNGNFRPGIVHRIDKDTSGLLVVAKNDYAHQFLQNQLKDKTMHREYYALIEGGLSSDDVKIIAPLAIDKKNHLKRTVDVVNGKDAVTYVHVEERIRTYTLVSCRLETGRTHQIRVHLAYIKHPIVGDTTYGYKKSLLTDKGQMLHAYKLSFIHPKTEKLMEFTCDVDEEFKIVLNKIRSKAQ